MLTARMILACATAAAAACAPSHTATTPSPAPGPGTSIRYTTRPDSSRFIVARVISLDTDHLVATRSIPDIRGRHVVDTLAPSLLTGLQVRVGRSSNSTMGLAVGGLAGLGLGMLCAQGENHWVVSDEGCLTGYVVLGAGLGYLLGSVTHRDSWSPVLLPLQPLPPAPPAVTVAPVHLGVKVMIRTPPY